MINIYDFVDYIYSLKKLDKLDLTLIELASYNKAFIHDFEVDSEEFIWRDDSTTVSELHEIYKNLFKQHPKLLDKYIELGYPNSSLSHKGDKT